MSAQTLPRAPVRMQLALMFILVVGGLLAARLFYWQIVKWDQLSQIAKKQSSMDVPIPARRGDIQTRDNLRLATDIFVFTVEVSPEGIPDRAALAKQLAPILKQPEGTVLAKLNTKASSVVLARDVPLEIGGAVQDLKTRSEVKHPELGLSNVKVRVKA